MRTQNRRGANRTALLACLLCLVIAFLFSEALALTQANDAHNHYGDGACAACARIQSIGELLKQFGAAAGGVLFALTGCFAALAVFRFLSSSLVFQTPVYLKSRLNN